MSSSGLRDEEVTIAEVLSEAGYATAHFGKGHLGDTEESYLHNQGFDCRPGLRPWIRSPVFGIDRVMR